LNHQDKIDLFLQKKKHQLGMGGEKKLKTRASEGKMNARERIAYLYDPGTFQEIGLFTHSTWPGMAEKTPGDGKITGYGRIQGRPVGTVANDLTVLGASSAATNMKRIEYMRALCCEKGMPLVWLAESAGARMPDTMGSSGMGQGGQNPAQYRRLREAPWISTLLGPCFGSSSWYSAMSDINVMLKGAAMAVSSPKVTQIATGETTPMEELGGWKLHAETTGLVDAVGETEQACIDLAKKYLSYLPLHANEPAPRAAVPEESGKNLSSILDLLPEKLNRAYDMKKIIETVVDDGQFLELKGAYARPCITAFARLDGHSVGVVANNPLYGAGALTADCCDKVTNFLVLCDSFNIPIIMFVDTPGFMIGKSGEKKKVTGKIINWMNALALMTVPVLTVIVRKCYGQAYLNMGGGKHSSSIVAWPTAQIGFMDPRPGINVVYNLKEEDDPERYAELLKQMDRDAEPWGAAGMFGLNDVIDPRETREFLIRMLELHRNRLKGSIGEHLMHCWPTSY